MPIGKKPLHYTHETKYEDAIKVLKRAVTIQNNFDEGYYWMGKCYEKLNKKDASHTKLPERFAL